jgi:hypothetical protein
MSAAANLLTKDEARRIAIKHRVDVALGRERVRLENI